MTTSTNTKYRDGILTYLLGLSSHAVSVDFFREVRKKGLTTRQWRVLGTLWDEENMTMTELSSAVFCEQSTTTRLVERLYELGWVGKRVDEADQRKVRVYLTEGGLAHIKDLVDLSHVLEKKISETIGLERTELLKTQLREIIERFTTPPSIGGAK